MTDGAARRAAGWADRLLPATLRGRILGVMVVGVLLSQVLGSAIWAWQLRDTARHDARDAARQTAASAAAAIRFLRDLPGQYRPLLIDQLRQMGGTRFFVAVNRQRVPVQPVGGFAARAHRRRRGARHAAAPSCRRARVPTSRSPGRRRCPSPTTAASLRELPENWVVAPMLLRAAPRAGAGDPGRTSTRATACCWPPRCPIRTSWTAPTRSRATACCCRARRC